MPSGSDIEIDHVFPLEAAWHAGAHNWPLAKRVSFANDPANLVAVQGQINQAKKDKEPALWMPPNKAFHCQYATQFIAVMREYRLTVDAPSVPTLRDAAATCPTNR